MTTAQHTFVEVVPPLVIIPTVLNVIRKVSSNGRCEYQCCTNPKGTCNVSVEFQKVKRREVFVSDVG